MTDEKEQLLRTREALRMAVDAVEQWCHWYDNLTNLRPDARSTKLRTVTYTAVLTFRRYLRADGNMVCTLEPTRRAACTWPMCQCDPYAIKVLAAAKEQAGNV